MELTGWSEPGFDDHGVATGPTVEHDLATLRAPTGTADPGDGADRARRGAHLAEREDDRRLRPEPGRRGGAHRERRRPGTEITIRHAEVLQDGELCTEPLRAAEATDRYTLRGDGTEIWRPGSPSTASATPRSPGGQAISIPTTSLRSSCTPTCARTGWFECSDERVNRLHENVVWGMRGNFVGIPTDCPQRDERLGWTGDIGVFAPTATFLYDCAGVLESWLRDLAAEQRDDGTVPWVIPDSLDWLLPAAVWGDAAVTVPSTVYERFGDVDILRAQYPSMRAWVELELELAGDDLLWTGGFQFADWLDPTARSGDAFDQRTDPDLLATAAMIHSLDLIAAAADLLERA